MDIGYLCQYDSDQNATMAMSAHGEWVDAALLPKQKFCSVQPETRPFTTQVDYAQLHHTYRH